MGKYEDEKRKVYGNHDWAWYRIPARDFVKLDEDQRNLLFKTVCANEDRRYLKWGETPYDVPFEKMEIISLSNGNDHKWGDISHLDRHKVSVEEMREESLRIGKEYVPEKEYGLFELDPYWKKKLGVD